MAEIPWRECCRSQVHTYHNDACEWIKLNAGVGWWLAPPVHNESASMHDLVIEDMKDRKQFGLNKYQTILQAHNGRNALKDAYEEILDLAVYLRQALEEQGG